MIHCPETLISALSDRIAADPCDVAALVKRGLCHARLREFRNAIHYYDRAIQCDSSSADGYHNRGNAWIELGKLRKGIADLTKAIKVDPKSAVSYTSRGVAQSRKGNYANAITDHEHALGLEPESILRQATLAELLAICPDSRYRDGPRALALISKVCEDTDYENVNYISCLAAAHALTGDFASATKWQKIAIRKSADGSEIADMQEYLRSYEANAPCFMKPPSWRQRWA